MDTVQLTITEPCHANWAAMNVIEQGRFCSSCNKAVTDFSEMNNNQILQILLKSEANICGRFNNAQLNAPLLTSDQKDKRWHKYFFGLLIPTLFFTKQLNAQKKTGKVKAVAVTNNVVRMGLVAYTPPIRNFKIAGAVTDSATNEIISGASIKIKDGSSGVSADSAGRFSFNNKTSSSFVMLEVSAVGFETKELMISIPVNDFILSDEVIKLNKTSTLLSDVVITANGERYLKGLVGGVSVRYKTSRYNLMVNRISSFINGPIKIYPNPATKGNLVHVALQLKTTGQYSMQVLNTSGQLLQQQQVIAVSANITQTIRCGNDWAAGIYFIRIINNRGMLISTIRFIVQ